MRMLIVTQKIDKNDDVLGFMHGWVNEFARNCKKVTVICLYEGVVDLPVNVKVLSLGKERLEIKKIGGIYAWLFKFLYTYRFYKYIWREKSNYDAVFVHMNQIYVLLGGPLWKFLRKKIGLWYAHGHVSPSLKLSEKFADVIFTSTLSGFRIASRKIKVVGQGIEIGRFENKRHDKKDKDFLKLISIGRISPVKDYETVIRSLSLVRKLVKAELVIIGGIGLSKDRQYYNSLKNLVQELGLEKSVNFAGPIPNNLITQHLSSADIFVNMSHTGSMDKAVLEAMAAGLPVLTCNEAFNGELANFREILMVKKRNYNDLALKIINLTKLRDEKKEEIIEYLMDRIRKNHSLDKLIEKILVSY